MPFQEDFEEFLDEPQGFATTVMLTPALGRPYRIKGIFSNEYLNLDSGIAGFSGSNPIFECSATVLKAAEWGDFLKLEKVTYRIVGIKPDGTGWVKLELERQD